MTDEPDPLGPATRAFEAGDWASVRRLTAALQDHPDEAVRRRAHELRARVGIDPVEVGVVLACVALLVAVFWGWVLGG
ncbi:MAG: hypothetical protein NZ898_12525 [Myxococcota bacterium]|nr:hypothetical protein [Myxococcota bacterium]MDW8362308.1 hypothetical protein [Myxococcales bacterium]